MALELLGEPSRRTTSGEWRYGRKGSLAVHVAGHRAGTWRDHEAGVGGGVLDLLEHVEGIDRAEALVWLRRRDLLDGAQPPGDAARRFAGAEVAGRRGAPDNRSAGNLARRSAPESAEHRGLGPIWVQTLWRRAVPIPAAAEHPARRWLAARHLWRPEMHLPPAVRWIPAEGGPAAGAVVAAFAAPGAGRVSAVHLVHVDGDGLPAPDRTGPDGLHKRSYGAMSGAVCVLGLVDAAGGVQVCEGLADGLALAARDPWPAVVMGGTASYRNRDLARWLAGLGPVQVWSDGDRAGVGTCWPGSSPTPWTPASAWRRWRKPWVRDDRRYSTPTRGVRFTSEAFTQTLQEQRVQVSMDGKGRYLDNIFVERLWRSIKYEEVYLKAYQTVAEARTGINAYLEFYNRQRPHQALGYRTPAEVYQHGQEERGAAAEEAGLPSGLVKPSAGVGDSLNLALVLS